MMPVKTKQANGNGNGVVYGRKGPMVPLAELLKRELKNEKIEKPTIRHGQAGQSKKGEDFTLMKLECQKIPGDGSSTFAVFAIFDGHNGSAAALYSKENLLKDIMSAMPTGLSREDWLSALPRAMVAGFVKTDKEFQVKEQTSGTTVTFVIIDGWTVTIAFVGDSRCILESPGGLVSLLTADHRLEANLEERERIMASGGEIGRLNTVGGAEIFDGHNGSATNLYSKENLLKDIMSSMPTSLSREDWFSVLPRAMVAGFVKTDKEFQVKEQTSGTTVTFVIIDGWTVTVASVGDSRCILESPGGLVSLLTADHRLEANLEERERIMASGGEIGRLNTVGGAEIGPLRCWPGGLCLSRSIGDMDVGEFIVPIPHVKQVKLSNAGGRLIIATDGVWDALSSEKAANCCRGLPAELAAKQIVKEALRIRGLRDDTTCIVVDLIPPEKSAPPAPVKKEGKFKNFFRRKSTDSSSKSVEKQQNIDIVQEIFEEGSAMLAERLGSEYTVQTVSGLFACAVCQTDITPSEGISVHAGSFFSGNMRSWEGPFLCASCKLKKDAMEGKRSSRVTAT